MEQLVARLGGAQDVAQWVWTAALLAARLGPLTIFAPWLALRSAPTATRIAVMFALIVALLPLASANGPEAIAHDPVSAALMLTREILVGGVFAVALALPLYALDWAGRLVDTWRGASLAEVLTPGTGERTSPLGDLYLFVGIVFFFVVGAHRVALAAFVESWRIAPLGRVWAGSGADAVALGAARLTAQALALAASFAAPASVAVLLTEAVMALIARTTSQMPMFFVGMPARAAAGVVAVALSLSMVVAALSPAFLRAIDAAATLIASLASP